MYGNLSIKLMIQGNILFFMVVTCMYRSGYELRTRGVSGTLSEAEKCLQVSTLRVYQGISKYSGLQDCFVGSVNGYHGHNIMVKNYIFKGTSFKALEQLYYQTSFTKIFIGFNWLVIQVSR